jgi:hypothetical protein
MKNNVANDINVIIKKSRFFYLDLNNAPDLNFNNFLYFIANILEPDVHYDVYLSFNDIILDITIIHIGGFMLKDINDKEFLNDLYNKFIISTISQIDILNDIKVIQILFYEERLA